MATSPKPRASGLRCELSRPRVPCRWGPAPHARRWVSTGRRVPIGLNESDAAAYCRTPEDRYSGIARFRSLCGRRGWRAGGPVRPSRYVRIVGNLPKPNQSSGPLTDHVRKGRVYKSPLAATGALSIANWLKDDLPDLLWPALVLAERGNNGVRQFVQWQAAVQANLAHHDDSEWLAETLDGRLTNLATLAERYPDASAIVVDAANRRGLLSEEVRRALASYPYLPARWLVGDVEVAPGQVLGRGVSVIV